MLGLVKFILIFMEDLKFLERLNGFINLKVRKLQLLKKQGQVKPIMVVLKASVTVKNIFCLEKSLPSITFGHDSTEDLQFTVKDTKHDHLWLHAMELLAVH